MLAALISAASFLGGGTDQAPPPSVSAQAPTRVERAVMRSEPVEHGVLTGALGVRMPHVKVLPFEASSFAAVEGQPFAYIEVLGGSAPGVAVSLTIILSDGRAYLRRFVPDPEDRVRSIATILANTLVAIEQERALPTKTDAEIPEPEPELAPSQEPVVQREAEPQPRSEPDRPPPDPKPKPGPELGLELHTGLMVPLAPAPQLSAAAGLAVGAAFPSGFIVDGEARWAGRGNGGFVQSRVRIVVRVGYRLRYRQLELIAAAGPSVEPWLVTDGGTVQRPRRQSGGAASAPLLGATAILAPGVLVRPRGRRLVFRIGGRVELAGSALPSGGIGRVRQVRAIDSEPETLFALGGFELVAGLSLALWVGG